MSEKIKVASLYCGAGGLDFGFNKRPSFDHVFANDFDKSACATYLENFPDSANALKCGPIENFVPDLMRMKIDLLLAGFPCPSWSMAGKRKGFDDKRGQEFFTCLSVLHGAKPQMFIFENVKGLLSHNGGESFAFMLTALKNLGYRVVHQIIKMSRYGVPTERTRVILIGVLDHNVDPHEAFPKVSAAGDLSLRRVLETVAAAPNLANHNHHAPQKKMHWIQVLKEGESLPLIKREIIEARERELGLENLKIPTSIMDYRRLDRNKIAPTMMFGNTSLPIHPFENRNLSVREVATIQGFPLDFVFKGGISAQYKQVGNAVPPLFSDQLAERVEELFVKMNDRVESAHSEEDSETSVQSAG